LEKGEKESSRVKGEKRVQKGGKSEKSSR